MDCFSKGEVNLNIQLSVPLAKIFEWHLRLQAQLFRELPLLRMRPALYSGGRLRFQTLTRHPVNRKVGCLEQERDCQHLVVPRQMLDGNGASSGDRKG